MFRLGCFSIDANRFVLMLWFWAALFGRSFMFLMAVLTCASRLALGVILILYL